MDMPRSVRLFERLYLGSIALGFIYGLLLLSSSRLGFSDWVSTIIGILISVGLVLLTSRKKSVIFKWILTVFFIVGVVFWFIALLFIGEISGIAGGIGGLDIVVVLIQTFMQGYGLYLLFRSDSTAWFASKKAVKKAVKKAAKTAVKKAKKKAAKKS